MDWLGTVVVFLWGAYLVWKVDKLDDQVKELRAASRRLDHQRDLIANLEHRLDQLEHQTEAVFRRLHNLEYPPPTPAQREAMQAGFETIGEQIRQERERREREGEP